MILPALALLPLAVASDFWTVLPVVRDVADAARAEEDAPTGTVTFDGKWNETLKGQIKGGRTVEVLYDHVRASHRATAGAGIATWGVEGTARFYLADGTTTVITFPAIAFDESSEAGAVFAVPSPFLLRIPDDAVDVHFSFRNWAGGVRPIESTDDNNGFFYRFPCQPAHPTVLFPADGEPILTGKLLPGDTITIQYDPTRAKRRGEKHAAPTWGVDGVVAFQGKGKERTAVRFSAVRFEVHDGMPLNKPLPLPFTTAIPAGTRTIEVWFDNWTGNAPKEGVIVDSVGGQIWTFPVAKP